MRTPVSIGVVGHLASAQPIVNAFEQLPQAELRWLCGGRRTARAAVSRRLGVRYTDRIGDLLDDEKLDAVVIAAPISTRYEFAAAAVDADKHVYVAGALAQRADEADELLQQARRRARCLVTGDIHLFDPAVDRLDGMLRSGVLGDVLYLRCVRTIAGRARDEDDLLWGPGAEELALLLHLLGDEPTSIDARAEAYLDPTAPDVLLCRLSFATGIVAQIHLSALDARPLSTQAVVGSRATAVLERSPSMPRRGLTIYSKALTDRRGEGTAFVPGDVISPHVAVEDPVTRSCEAFLSAVRSTVESVSRGREAVTVVETLETIQRSLARGGSVELPRARTASDLRLVGTPTPAR